MRAVVIGASAGLGRALADSLAAAGHDLLLVASDARDLDPVARDLALRHGRAVSWLAADLVAAAPDALASACLDRLGGIDALFLIAGLGDDADCGPLPADRLARLLAVNFTAPVALVNALLPRLIERTEPAYLVGIGSVAAIRGRSRNIAYGAAKRGFEFYVEALRHRLAGTPCRVQFYRAGFMDTAMLGSGTAGPLVARPETVARAIVRRLGRGGGVAYLPGWWALIALILNSLPFALFRRLRF